MGLGSQQTSFQQRLGLGASFWGFIKQLPQSVGIEFSFGAWGLPVTVQFPKAVGALGFVLGLTKQVVQSVGIEVSFWGLGLRAWYNLFHKVLGIEVSFWGLRLNIQVFKNIWGLELYKKGFRMNLQCPILSGSRFVKSQAPKRRPNP